MVEENSDKNADGKASDSTDSARHPVREVAADLIENVPESGGLSHWVLASPMLIFLAWIWVDLFAHFSPVPSYWLDAMLALVVYILIFVLPLGAAAFFVVTSFPRLFSHAGWDVQPLEPVRESEIYTVRYRFQNRRRASDGWGLVWGRAAQGWVYLEIAAILIGAIVMIPIFFSVSDFGFGQP